MSGTTKFVECRGSISLEIPESTEEDGLLKTLSVSWKGSFEISI
jgi:hypothetical protein